MDERLVFVFTIVSILAIIVAILDNNQKYTEFRVEGMNDNRWYRVEVKGWFVWKSAFVYTNFFGFIYETKEDALIAIEEYKNRFTEVH